ncbi:RNA polymerase II-associated protein 1 [Acipenser ruthenus]|uniref:RNA polymerase II-associated protein 1 n=1 Tax=Acipenser ruthenus TaxID=7906 RepID=A0A444UFX6_ACIRT|nr:RNA polymerase II-associated protein 1 [Acipenser ruthenus]
MPVMRESAGESWGRERKSPLSSDTDRLPVPLQLFTSPPEDSLSLLQLYFRALVMGALRRAWCPVLYAVAISHLNTFLFSQEPAPQVPPRYPRVTPQNTQDTGAVAIPPVLAVPMSEINTALHKVDTARRGLLRKTYFLTDEVLRTHLLLFKLPRGDSELGFEMSCSVLCNPNSCSPGPESIPSLPCLSCCGGKPALSLAGSQSPFPFLTGLCYLLHAMASTHRGLAGKFSPLLLSEAVIGYLRSCCEATPPLSLSSGWLLRHEYHLQYLLLKLAARLALLKMQVLARLRYILEVVRPGPRVVQDVLEVLTRIARHSSASASQLNSLGLRERLSRYLALEPQDLLLEPREAVRLSTEALRLWSIAAGELYPILVRALQCVPSLVTPPDPEEPLHTLSLHRAEALVSLLTNITLTAGSEEELQREQTR